MPVTSPDNIYYPDTSTANAPSVYTGAMADSVQAAFDVANARIDGVEGSVEFEEFLGAITPDAGYTIGGQVVRRFGKVVSLFVTATKSTAWGAATDTIGTLNQASLRPVTRQAVGSGYNNTTATISGGQVTTGGAVILFGAGAAGSQALVMSATWIIP